jgi:hypothetical protein
LHRPDFRHTASSGHWFRFLLHSLIGAGIGGLSLLIFPRHLVGLVSLRVAALVLDPIENASPEPVWRVPAAR